jgi:hypothetical protein
VGHKTLLGLCGLQAILCWPACAAPLDLTPLPNTNQSPVTQIYGLPALGSFRLLHSGAGEAQISLVLTNHFSGSTTPEEELLFDGETHRVNLALRYGAKNDTEWGIELPYVAHGGGSLDGLIENWHDIFGLFQGGRDKTPRNVLDYHYFRNGVEKFNFTQSGSGIGDVRLTAAHQLNNKADSHRIRAAFRTSIKLPTGNSSQFRGSGAADLAVWLSAGCETGACHKRWGWYGGGGLLFLGKGEVLPGLQRSTVFFGGYGIGWRATPNLTIKGQLDGHSAFYKHSALRQLADPALQLTLGGTWMMSNTTALDFGLAEDLIVNASPDVSFLVSLRTHF